MTEPQNKPKSESEAQLEASKKPSSEPTPKGLLARFRRKFFGRKKVDPKKSDPNIYPLY